MKSSDPNHEALLSDLYDGPAVEAVLGKIRQEKAAMQRRRRGAAGATIAVFAVAACFFSLREPSRETQRTAHLSPASGEVSPQTAAPATPAPFQVERINDEQLIELLEGNPVALVHLPSGEQRLLLMGKQQSEADSSIISL